MTFDDIDLLPAEINARLAKAKQYADKAQDFRIGAGKMLIEARKLVDAGAAGDMTWTAWVKANIKRSLRDCQKLMAMAGAADPNAAHDLEKARNRAAVTTHRAKAADVSRVPSAAETSDDTDASGAAMKRTILRFLDQYDLWDWIVGEAAIRTRKAA